MELTDEAKTCLLNRDGFNCLNDILNLLEGFEGQTRAQIMEMDDAQLVEFIERFEDELMHWEVEEDDEAEQTEDFENTFGDLED